MNDLKAIIEVLRDIGIPSPILMSSLAVILGCWLFKKLVDMLHEAGQNNRAKYDWLVESLGKPTVQQSHYLIEQAYARYLSEDPIDYDDLEALLKRKDPSFAVRAFVAHRRYLVIQHDSSEFSYKPIYAFWLYRNAFKVYYLFMYFSGASCAGLLGFMLYHQNLASSFYLIGPVSFVGWAFASLSRYQELSEAMEFMEPGSQRFWPRFQHLSEKAKAVITWLWLRVRKFPQAASPARSTD